MPATSMPRRVTGWISRTWAVRYVTAPANLPAIRRQHQDLLHAWQAVRHPRASTSDLALRPDRTIDFETTAARIRERAAAALDAGMTPAAPYQALTTVSADEMRLILRKQLPQTARFALAYGAICMTAVVAWFVLALLYPDQYAAPSYIAGWLVMILCLAALTLRELWVNWMVRTERLAPLSAFLRTDDSWMPSW